MLSAHPQSIMQLFFSSIKTYKKIFIPLLPLTIIVFIIGRSSDLCQTSSSFEVRYVAIPLLSLLDIICLCWGICLVYGLMAGHKASYKVSFYTAFRKVFKANFLLIIAGAISGGVLGILSYQTDSNFGYLLDPSKPIFWVLATVVSVLAFYIFSLGTIYPFEVLIKNAKVFPAMKKAAKISFSTLGLKRNVYFAILLLTLFIIFFLVGFFLPNFNDVVSSVVVDMLMSIWLPYSTVLSVCFYHDLVLRFENRP